MVGARAVRAGPGADPTGRRTPARGAVPDLAGTGRAARWPAGDPAGQAGRGAGRTGRRIEASGVFCAADFGPYGARRDEAVAGALPAGVRAAPGGLTLCGTAGPDPQRLGRQLPGLLGLLPGLAGPGLAGTGARGETQLAAGRQRRHSGRSRAAGPVAAAGGRRASGPQGLAGLPGRPGRALRRPARPSRPGPDFADVGALEMGHHPSADHAGRAGAGPPGVSQGAGLAGVLRRRAAPPAGLSPRVLPPGAARSSATPPAGPPSNG